MNDAGKCSSCSESRGSDSQALSNSRVVLQPNVDSKVVDLRQVFNAFRPARAESSVVIASAASSSAYFNGAFRPVQPVRRTDQYGRPIDIKYGQTEEEQPIGYGFAESNNPACCCCPVDIKIAVARVVPNTERVGWFVDVTLITSSPNIRVPSRCRFRQFERSSIPLNRGMVQIQNGRWIAVRESTPNVWDEVDMHSPGLISSEILDSIDSLGCPSVPVTITDQVGIYDPELFQAMSERRMEWTIEILFVLDGGAMCTCRPIAKRLRLSLMPNGIGPNGHMNAAYRPPYISTVNAPGSAAEIP